ncbi:MAG: 2-dehydro-3-deoxygalactonokinase, partial [Pseudomonadota bacterium]
MASQPTHFIAGDWGTSSLRLFLCKSDGAILGRVETGDGILSVAAGAFEATLIEKTEAWRARDDLADQQLPVVLSGMIGSRQGWR